MALTKVTGGLISTTSNYEVGVITATKFVGPIEGGVTGITTGSDKIKVIDESSDTTCFPLFATHSDGYLAAKSGSNLTFNSNNGTLTATTFSGALTGNVNGNATGLSGTPSIVVKDITAEMVSVAGTMQYEDVVNVDATGIVTAGGGLVVPANKVVTITGDLNVDGKTDLDDLSVAGVSTFADDVNLQGANAGVTSAYWDKSANEFKFIDNTKLSFGTGQDLKIYHETNTTTNWIEGAGLIRLQTSSGNIEICPKNGAEKGARFVTDGAAELYYNGTKRISTSGIGVTVTGEVAATQDYPNFRPSLDLNFAAVKKLDPRITYYRSGPASYTDEFGIVKLVGANTPRFDHDPSTRESKGLLIEESRTNINMCTTWRRSSDDRFSMNTAAEQLSGLNTNSVVGPDGTAKGVARAWFTGSESNPGGSVYVMASTSTSNGAHFTTTNTHTSSCWIRPGLETVFRMDAHSNYASASASGSADTISFTFTLTGDGTVTTIESGGISASVTKYPNNWYRCTVTYHRNSTSSVQTAYGVIVYPVNYASYNTNSQTGDIAWFWGPQVEKGSHPTSYIQNPNDGTFSTRGADAAHMDAIGDSFYNQLEGSVIMEYNYTEEADGAHSLFSFSGKESDPEASNPRQWLRINKTAGTARGIRYSLTTDAGSSSDDSSAVATPGQWDKFAFAYIAGDQDLYLNGSSILDLSRTPPTNCYRLAFGNVGWTLGTETIMLEGHIRRFMYYPKKLPNSQLNTLTS